MIQPIKRAKTEWILFWIDVDEPVHTGRGFILPTLIVVSDPDGVPIGPPELMEELDQSRAENLLHKLFEQHTPPDRVTIGASEDWDPEAWKAFSREAGVEIRFQKFNQNDPASLEQIFRTFSFGLQKGGPVENPREVARGLVATALQLRSPRKRLSLFKKALERDPDCAAARIELADLTFQDGHWKKALDAYEETLAREEPRWRNRYPVWWEDLETRPYLRAHYGRAMTLWHLGHHAEAADGFETLLEMNPTDHQGARFLIPLVWLLADRQEVVTEFFEYYEARYPKDFSEPAFLFGWAFSLHNLGKETEAKAKYREGILKNLYLAPLLLEAPEPPANLWHPNDRAEPAYANEFIESYAVLWDRDPAALRLVRETYEELLPLVQQILAHRQQMIDFQDQRYDPEYRAKWQALIAEDERLAGR
ncbi:MAG TPA: tetratricopeptide repeat protein [Chthoniobacterales bacterium]